MTRELAWKDGQLIVDLRHELWAVGCHLDVYDSRVAAGEDPKAVALDVMADWRAKQEGQRRLDAMREVPRQTGAPAVIVEQTEPAIAKITLPGSRRRK